MWLPEDAEAYFSICDHNEVARFYGWRPGGLAEVEELLVDLNGREAGLGVTTWAVAWRDSGELIGSCGYARTNAAWMSSHVVEIGWLIDFRLWGTGLASEAGRAALGIGEERLDPSRIVSKCDVRNVRSEKVMQRIGLRRAGVVARGDSSTVVYRHERAAPPLHRSAQSSWD